LPVVPFNSGSPVQTMGMRFPLASMLGHMQLPKIAGGVTCTIAGSRMALETSTPISKMLVPGTWSVPGRSVASDWKTIFFASPTCPVGVCASPMKGK
jgi:hypothetical protein